MLDIVVYEDNMKLLQKDVSSINLALANLDIDYRIHKCKCYDNELQSFIKKSDSKKIYVLGSEVNGVSGLEVATKIREYDWDSIIIVTIGLNNYKYDNLYTRMMILDFVSNKNSERFIDDIRLAVSIIDKHRVFVFKYNHVIYRIPYNQICYIEKEPDVKRCIIHTLKKNYYISDTINGILNHLNDDFCRTHQSCIVNLGNIEKIDLSSNIIIFRSGGKTNMLTDKMKKEVKKFIGIN